MRDSPARGESSPAPRDPALRNSVNGPTGLFGAYRLVRLIGEGGTSQVFLAVHEQLGRRVALKLLRPEFALQREGIGMLLAEARAVNRINHPHIAQVTDFVESAHAAYLVMEFVEGHTLRHELERGPLDLVRALRIAHQVADAMTAAHAVGVVHCDLKPENIIQRAEDDETKLLDFGIAQYDDDELVERYGTRHRLGYIAGTPRYMSPEQAMGHPVDGRSDIYALGLILYEMVTGQPPYVGTPEEELACQVEWPAPHLRSALPDAALRIGVPSAVVEELDALVASCMSKSPEERVQEMATLRSALHGLWSRAVGVSLNSAGPRPWFIKTQGFVRAHPSERDDAIDPRGRTQQELPRLAAPGDHDRFTHDFGTRQVTVRGSTRSERGRDRAEWGACDDHDHSGGRGWRSWREGGASSGWRSSTAFGSSG